MYKWLQKICTFLLAWASFFAASAQTTATADSLQKALRTAQNDTQKINILNQLGSLYRNSDMEVVKKYSGEALRLAKKANYKKGMVDSYNNIGNTYFIRGKYPETLEYYIKALKVVEELGDKKGIANSLMGVGNIHGVQGNYEQALDYYARSLEIRKELKDTIGVSWIYNNMGSVYISMKNFEKALEYQLKSFEIKKELGDRKTMSSNLGNIGSIYYELGDYKKALDYQQQALEIRKEVNNRKGVAMSYSDIGNIYRKLNQPEKAIENYRKSLSVAHEVGYQEIIKNAHGGLANLYEEQQNLALALDHYKHFTAVKDNMLNIKNSEQIAEMAAKYESEKKEKEIQLKNAEIDRKEAEISEQNTQRNALVGGLSLMLLLSVVVVRNYRIKQRANVQLAQKNEIIEEKNKNITDSITYAKRIQEAILPTPEYIQSLFNKHFIINSPRDIISGDFFWMHHNEEENKVVWTVADCTGHGVPGSLMSMIGNTLLNEVVIEKRIFKADQILNLLREEIIKSLKQKGQEGEAKDGMDMSLCVLDLNSYELEYAGANNPLYLIQNSELKEIKADRQPIGYYTGEQKPFTPHQLWVKPGDQIYLFSDGFPDQFGGQRGKKYGYRQFKKLLLQTHAQPVKEQEQIITDTFEAWKGSEEQVDDVLIMGVKV